MGTRAYIGKLLPSGRVRVIEVRNDGYLESLGVILNKYWDTESRVKELFSYGSSSSVGAYPYVNEEWLNNNYKSKYTDDEERLNDNMRNIKVDVRHPKDAVKPYLKDKKGFICDLSWIASDMSYSYYWDGKQWWYSGSDCKGVPTGWIKLSVAVKSILPEHIHAEIREYYPEGTVFRGRKTYTPRKTVRKPARKNTHKSEIAKLQNAYKRML